MPTAELNPTIIAALAAISIVALLTAVFSSRLDRNAQGNKRLAAIARAKTSGDRPRSEDSKRSDIEKTLREMDEKQKSMKGSRPSLLIRMRQAGLPWTRRGYYIYSALVAAGTFLLVLGSSPIGQLPALGFGIAAGLLVPHLHVGYLRARRFRAFAKEFPNAIDVIVRGIKSGLPVVDCLRIISVDAQEPVQGEFKEVVEDQTLGLPVDQAVQRLASRVPLAEAKFFAIVISMQSRTGGNLSDALGGLSKVLRERQKMQAKIRAMSAEAKTSAGIIGAMPVIVAALMYFAAPSYIEGLFATFAGKIILAGCATWMLFGILVMRKMIRFDF
jgi:tight adherence protein B